MLHYRWPGLAFELFCFAIEFGMASWLFTKPQTEKKRLSLVRLSTIFSLRNVVVPTAVESHIANVTYHRSVY